MATHVHQVEMTSREMLWLTGIRWTALPPTDSWAESVELLYPLSLSQGFSKSISDALLLATKVSDTVLGERSTGHTDLKDHVTCSEDTTTQKGIQMSITKSIKHLAIGGWSVVIAVVLIKFVRIILLLRPSLFHSSNTWTESSLSQHLIPHFR